MQKNITQLLLAVLALLFFVSLNACNPDHPEYVLPTKKIPQSQIEPIKPVIAPTKPEIKPEPLAEPEIKADPAILRVGISPYSPPFIFQKDDKIQGLEADMAQKLATFTKKTVHFIKIPKKRATEALLQDQVDIIMSGLTIVSEKDRGVTFSDPYLRTGQVMLVRTRDASLFSTGIYSLEKSNFIVGVIEGSVADLFLTKTMRGVKIMRLKTMDATIKALTAKKIDIFLHDAPTICYLAANLKSAALTPIPTMVTEEFMGWKMRSEDEELRHQVNLFIKTNKDSGELQKSLTQWIPKPL